jgi:hypothetical protein
MSIGITLVGGLCVLAVADRSSPYWKTRLIFIGKHAYG